MVDTSDTSAARAVCPRSTTAVAKSTATTLLRAVCAGCWASRSAPGTLYSERRAFKSARKPNLLRTGAADRRGSAYSRTVRAAQQVLASADNCCYRLLQNLTQQLPVPGLVFSLDRQPDLPGTCLSGQTPLTLRHPVLLVGAARQCGDTPG